MHRTCRCICSNRAITVKHTATFGAHMETRAGEAGVVFRVWAPHAVAISVVGDFNSWKPGSHPMRKVDGDSVWELFIPGMKDMMFINTV